MWAPGLKRQHEQAGRLLNRNWLGARADISPVDQELIDQTFTRLVRQFAELYRDQDGHFDVGMFVALASPAGVFGEEGVLVPGGVG